MEGRLSKKFLLFFLFCPFFIVTYFIVYRAVFSLEEYKTEDEEARAYNLTRVDKTVGPFLFRVEKDRPIEKVAGVYQPVDIASYIAFKFNKLEIKLNETSVVLEKRIGDLSAQVEVLSKKVEELSKAKNSLSQNQTATQFTP